MKEISPKNNAYDMHNEMHYEEFLRQINNTIPFGTKHLFTTAVPLNLFDLYLKCLPEVVRQHYTCHACREFVNHYGNLVYITELGDSIPAFWPNPIIVPDMYQKAVKACYEIVVRSRVDGVFYGASTVLGKPITGNWTHMSAKLPGDIVLYDRASEFMAIKKEEFKMLINGLTEFPIGVANQAVKLLKSESIQGYEKCLKIAEGFYKIHNQRKNQKNNQIRNNLTWKYVAEAPPGFCHIKSGMIGTLLEDIQNGCSFSIIKSKFEEKTDSLQYQRPQEDPTEGAKLQAEKLVEKLGINESFKRRFATFDEIEKNNFLWMSKDLCFPKEKKSPLGIFSNVKTKNEKNKVEDIEMDPQKITWAKFRDIILLEADKIEYYTGNRTDDFSAMVTAVDPESPPILQWDLSDKRNPFSWYLYHGGSTPNHWGLNFCEYYNVIGLTYSPHMWNGNEDLHTFINHSAGVLFIIEKAKDYNIKEMALFPSILKSDLHGIRSVIEAFSKNNKMEEAEGQLASGILFEKKEHGPHFKVRVTSNNQRFVYLIDRWD